MKTMNTIKEIKSLVDNGVKVYWKNEAYVVIKASNGYLIKCELNNHYVGLNDTYSPKDFFIKE